LDNEYPKSNRNSKKELDISLEKLRQEKGLAENEYLEGDLKLEDFANLEKLNCSGNKLVSLDARKCIRLRELNCKNNQLIKLNLNKSLRPTKLDLRGNPFFNKNNLEKSNSLEVKTFFNLPNLNLSSDIGKGETLVETDDYRFNRVRYDGIYPKGFPCKEKIEKFNLSKKDDLPTKLVVLRETGFNREERLKPDEVEKIKSRKREEIKIGKNERKYAILSYVWGKKKGVDELSRGGTKTLAKAIEACDYLKVKYL